MLSMVDILRYNSNITAVSLGGEQEDVWGVGSGWLFFLPVFVFCCCNSYVNRSIKLCMYVDDAKLDLTP